MSHPSLRKRLVRTGLALALAGCAHDFRLMKIEETLSSYGETIRWGLFQKATDFQAGPPAPFRDTEALKDIRVTSYNPLYRKEQDEGQILLQTVEIRYIHERDLMERTLTDNQRWRFDKKEDRWLLETGLPPFE
jgi:hypothetical protein